MNNVNITLRRGVPSGEGAAEEAEVNHAAPLPARRPRKTQCTIITIIVNDDKRPPNLSIHTHNIKI